MWYTIVDDSRISLSEHDVREAPESAQVGTRGNKSGMGQA